MILPTLSRVPLVGGAREGVGFFAFGGFSFACIYNITSRDHPLRLGDPRLVAADL